MLAAFGCQEIILLIIFILIEHNIFIFAYKATNSYDLLPIQNICWSWCAAFQIDSVQGFKETTINDFFHDFNLLQLGCCT